MSTISSCSAWREFNHFTSWSLKFSCHWNMKPERTSSGMMASYVIPYKWNSSTKGIWLHSILTASILCIPKHFIVRKWKTKSKYTVSCKKDQDIAKFLMPVALYLKALEHFCGPSWVCAPTLLPLSQAEVGIICLPPLCYGPWESPAKEFERELQGPCSEHLHFAFSSGCSEVLWKRM